MLCCVQITIVVWTLVVVGLCGPSQVHITFRGGTVWPNVVAHTYGVMGRQSDAERVLTELLAKSNTAYVEPVRVAFIYTALGQTDAALTQLMAAACI
jgi:hypothetical protein